MNDWSKSLHEPAMIPDARTRADLDMRTASSVIDAIETDRVMLFCQPVCVAGDVGTVVYLECVVRLLQEDRQSLVYPGNFLPCLERLRMTQYLDRHVMSRVIDLLQMYPHLYLGANISAQSVAGDEWWESTFLHLSKMPDVTRRLIVEITETAPLEDTSGRDFARRMQQLGSRVAIDDFGAGYGTETSAQIYSPDVVKIAGELLMGNGDRGLRHDELVRLVSLARDIAPCVVLEGVGSADALGIACDAGVDCVQGFYVGRPQNLAVHVPKDPVCHAGTCDSTGLSGNEITLVPLAKLSNLIKEVERSDNAGGAISAAAIERAVELFERNARAIVDQSVCCKLRDHAKLAYVTGLASSVFGKHSTIASTLRDEMAEVMREGKDNRDRPIQLLRCIAAFGRLHGQLIVCSFELHRAPGEPQT
jgi:EAL domain-containing protein (putative c-di-GMP-specific phosphodiesterase class I)